MASSSTMYKFLLSWKAAGMRTINGWFMPSRIFFSDSTDDTRFCVSRPIHSLCFKATRVKQDVQSELTVLDLLQTHNIVLFLQLQCKQLSCRSVPAETNMRKRADAQRLHQLKVLNCILRGVKTRPLITSAAHDIVANAAAIQRRTGKVLPETTKRTQIRENGATRRHRSSHPRDRAAHGHR